ncbi:transglutaminase family protein [Rhizobium sp. L1K21]|uniref:transglutaminase family protein n=1 Tax=Rhizobium sp. L1K21 TaxID=2954933 RepID=UPI0020938497|nr:transglutaminase family protein [Rhizobium sp. L1K21]MCO6184972.1 transglutaminase family protein [Rhizobium sp. L1K21]
MIYDIKLKITYEYDVPATGARHAVRILPVTIDGRQRLIAGALSFDPVPEERVDIVDFFGNHVSLVQMRAAHDKSLIQMQTRVQVEAPLSLPGLSRPLSRIAEEVATFKSMAGDAPHHFLGASPRLPIVPDVVEFAREFAGRDMPVEEIARAMCAGIHRDFKYDGKVTKVDTPLKEAFKLKAGVCQDFSHIMIAGLRSLGIPAGYVSGFLRTIPPPGKPRLEGADAMHAWVRVWGGRDAGWLEYDPTNDMRAGLDHIVVGYGRDYSDVAPVVGVLRSYGEHATQQSVDVVPVNLGQDA